MQQRHVTAAGHVKERSVTEGAAVERRAVKATGRPRDETTLGIPSIARGVGERMQARERAAGRYLEGRPPVEVTAAQSQTIEVSITSLGKGLSRLFSIGAVELVQHGHDPRGRHLEGGPAESAAADTVQPIEVPVGRLDETGVRKSAFHAPLPRGQE